MPGESSRYETALDLLRSPSSWCRGAEILAQLTDQRAIVPLLLAYERPAESGKACLLRAMRTLGASRVAPELARLPDPEQQRMGLHLMELFADDAHLPFLSEAVLSSNGSVKDQARKALRSQNQTAAWEAAMIRLLDSSDRDLREDAVSTLLSHRTPTAIEALTRHRPRESDPDLRRMIDAVRPLA